MNSKLIISLLAAIALVGCTSMRPMDAARVDLASQLEPGDHLVVYESSGRVLDMKFRDIEEQRIRGWDTESSGPVSVAVADIERLEIEKVDGVKTTLAVAGGTVAIAIVAAGAAILGSAAILAGGA